METLCIIALLLLGIAFLAGVALLTVAYWKIDSEYRARLNRIREDGHAERRRIAGDYIARSEARRKGKQHERDRHDGDAGYGDAGTGNE